MVLFAVALLVSMLVEPVPGDAKTLPPAFGKEFVPDKSSQDDDEKASDVDEKPNRPVVQRARRPGRGQKLHIQLDGDEDGGGVGTRDDGDDGDDGEF